MGTLSLCPPYGLRSKRGLIELDHGDGVAVDDREPVACAGSEGHGRRLRIAIEAPIRCCRPEGLTVTRTRRGRLCRSKDQSASGAGREKERGASPSAMIVPGGSSSWNARRQVRWDYVVDSQPTRTKTRPCVTLDAILFWCGRSSHGNAVIVEPAGRTLLGQTRVER